MMNAAPQDTIKGHRGSNDGSEGEALENKDNMSCHYSQGKAKKQRKCDMITPTNAEVENLEVVGGCGNTDSVEISLTAATPLECMTKPLTEAWQVQGDFLSANTHIWGHSNRSLRQAVQKTVLPPPQ